MIPTRYKTKLPRTHSYPIGAEAIDAALDSWRFVEPCSLSFTTEAVYQRGDKAVYRIFEIDYHPAGKPGYSAARWSIEQGFYERRWKVTVYAVPRELRHQVNRLLLERGLPEVVRWLKGSEREGWKSRYQQIELLFNPLDESLSTDEFSGAAISPSRR